MTAVAVLSLALGIGANTAMFSILNSLLLRSLAVQSPDRLLMLGGPGGSSWTNPIWEQVRAHRERFGGAAAWSTDERWPSSKCRSRSSA